LARSLIIIPTFNEKENVTAIVNQVLGLDSDYEILIIDDGSPDGTADVVKSLIPQFHNRLHLEQRKGKLGLGTAYIHGFKWALERNYELIFEMDCDFSHPPESLATLKNTCLNDEADIAVGSRYTKGGKVKNWPFKRLLLSYGASCYVRLITGMPVKDPTAGFVCYRAEVLRAINLDRIRFIGYAFQIEMKYKAWLKQFRILEIPITFKDRELGVSKMSTKIFKEGVVGVIILRLEKGIPKVKHH
jgi:dolichol-phosphate mannosyltransferase